jgi:2-hydroxychromene-2-carboxylate isomerase
LHENAGRRTTLTATGVIQHRPAVAGALKMRDDLAVSSEEPRFYFGAMSPYSWFAAERIETVLPQARWFPVLAGAVFKANDRTSWGLTDRREAGIADCEQRAATHGLGPIVWPDPWPTSDLLVARGMTHAMHEDLLRPFAMAAMRLCFREGADLGELASVLEAGRRCGIDSGELEFAIAGEHVKESLRALTAQTLEDGVFGVPSIVIGEELYWGDDTLERAASDFSRIRELKASG